MNKKRNISFLLLFALLLAACSSAPTPAPTINRLPVTGNSQPPAGVTFVPTAQASPATSPTPAPTQAPTQVETQAATLASATQVPTVPLTVTEVDTSASLGGINQTSYNGVCQASLSFKANISINAAGTVTYFWLRSDGTRSAESTLTFSGAGYQSVSDAWTLAAPGGIVSAADRVYIDQPNHKAFSAASLSLTCNPPLPTARPASSGSAPKRKAP